MVKMALSNGNGNYSNCNKSSSDSNNHNQRELSATKIDLKLCKDRAITIKKYS